MSAIAYPVAHDALEVLHKAEDLPRATREREASALSGKTVAFVSEQIEPGFATEDEARAAYPSVLAEGTGKIVCTFARRHKPKPSKPVMKDGRRWAEPKTLPEVRWKLSLSYWKIVTRTRTVETPSVTPHVQARAVRKKALGVALTPEEVQALAHAPLMAYRPQKALDHGLFEIVLPENPEIIIADE